MAFATDPRFVYAHGDLVIWDNRCTMHRASPFESGEHVREMRRTRTSTCKTLRPPWQPSDCNILEAVK